MQEENKNDDFEMFDDLADSDIEEEQVNETQQHDVQRNAGNELEIEEEEEFEK